MKESRRTHSVSSGQQIPGSLLPVELLLHIFYLGSLQDPEFPVTMSQVCSHWRRISIRSSRLWCYIRPDRRRYLCSRRIQRSKGFPLDIALDHPPISMTSMQTTLADVHTRMHSVIPAIQQWRSLSIHFTGYIPYLWNAALSELCPKLPSPTSHAPQLVRLSLIYPLNDDTKEFLLFGGHAPKLRDVSLHGIRLRWTAPLFENLTHLDYNHHAFTFAHEAVAEVLVMLRVSYKLQSLTISFPGGRSREDDASFGWASQAYTPISLGNLKLLVLRVVGDNIPREMTVLSSKLILPRLQRLRLVSGENSIRFGGREVSAVLGSLRRHSCLEDVIIENSWAHGRSIAAFLRSLPNVRFISARGRYVEDDFLLPLSKRVDLTSTPERNCLKNFALGGLEMLELSEAAVTTDGVLSVLDNTSSTMSVRLTNCPVVVFTRLSYMFRDRLL